MSQQNNDSKGFQRNGGAQPYSKIKGSYTQNGFYRGFQGKNQYNLTGNESAFDRHNHEREANALSDIGYSTLNPIKHGSNVADFIQEQQYEVLAIFELNREKQKNRILEERLKNKEIHISKMKEVHNELTEAFEKCQAELDFYKKKCNANVDARQYLEEINELKHLVIRLQDKITEYQKRENKRYNSVKAEMNADKSGDKKSVSNFQFKDGHQRQNKVKDKRSKTVANQQDSSPEFKKFDIIQQYIGKYPNRISNFIVRFLGMVEFFCKQAKQLKNSQQNGNIKKRLKVSWKWIKSIVIQWNRLTNYEQKSKRIYSKIQNLLNIQNINDQHQIMDAIESAIVNEK